MPSDPDPFDWGGDPFSALEQQNAPAPVNTPFQPQKRKRKAIPDQRTIFKLQRRMQKLEQEIEELERAGVDLDLRHVRRAYADAWKTLNAYLQEWAQ